MQRKQSLLSKSSSILNTVLLLIVAAFLLDLAIFGIGSFVLSPKTGISLIFPSYLSFLSSAVTMGAKIFLLVLVVVKILLYTGIYGSLTDFLSGREAVLTLKNFKNNIRKFWKIYLSLAVVVFFTRRFFINSYLGSFRLTQSGVSFLLDIIVLYIMARALIHYKYIKPLNLPVRKIPLKAEHTFYMLVFCVINIFIAGIPMFNAINKYILAEISFLAAIYIHFLAFCYLASIVLEQYPEIKNMDNRKELFLINPPCGGPLVGVASLILRLYPPFFGILRALTPSGYRIREFNRVIWRKRYYKADVLVGITCFTSNSYKAYKIAKEFKKRGSTVIMGGHHVSHNPDEALEYCDSVVIGEAEGVWGSILRDYEKDALKKKYIGYAADNYYEYSHSKLLSYSPEIIKDCLETTRGCKFNCEFCSIASFSKNKIRYKPIDEIVELIKKARRSCKKLAFIDANIFINPEYSKELFRRLIPFKIKWVASSSIDIAKDEKALELAKNSGCKMLLIGYEIGPCSSEKKDGKFLLAKEYILLSKKIKKAGISIKAHFIFGFDSDRPMYLIRLWWFCFRLSPSLIACSFLIPFPKTRLYCRLLKENRLVSLNWQAYANHLVFRHKYLSRRLASLSFPWMSLFFFLTTSAYGRVVFLALILGICFKM